MELVSPQNSCRKVQGLMEKIMYGLGKNSTEKTMHSIRGKTSEQDVSKEKIKLLKRVLILTKNWQLSIIKLKKKSVEAVLGILIPILQHFLYHILY